MSASQCIIAQQGERVFWSHSTSDYGALGATKVVGTIYRISNQGVEILAKKKVSVSKTLNLSVSSDQLVGSVWIKVIALNSQNEYKGHWDQQLTTTLLKQEEE